MLSLLKGLLNSFLVSGWNSRPECERTHTHTQNPPKIPTKKLKQKQVANNNKKDQKIYLPKKKETTKKTPKKPPQKPNPESKFEIEK